MFGTRLFPGPRYEDVMAILGSRITYFGMIGLGLLLGGWFVMEDQYLRDAPTAFRKAVCVVEDSGVSVHGRGRYGRPTSFAPVVTFTFAAGGAEHTVAGYRLYEGGMSESEAVEIAGRYEPGRESVCYYDPADPERAVLTLEADRRPVGLLFVFSILLLAGGLTGWAVLEYAGRRAAPAAAQPDPDEAPQVRV